MTNVECTDVGDCVKKCMYMDSGRLKKNLGGCVKDNMRFGLSRGDVQDKDDWRLKHKGSTG